MWMVYSTKVTLLPINEMTVVLSIKKKSMEIDKDTLVPMKIGIDKGDLAKVCCVDPLMCSHF